MKLWNLEEVQKVDDANFFYLNQNWMNMVYPNLKNNVNQQENQKL